MMGTPFSPLTSLKPHSAPYNFLSLRISLSLETVPLHLVLQHSSNSIHSDTNSATAICWAWTLRNWKPLSHILLLYSHHSTTTRKPPLHNLPLVLLLLLPTNHKAIHLPPVCAILMYTIHPPIVLHGAHTCHSLPRSNADECVVLVMYDSCICNLRRSKCRYEVIYMFAYYLVQKEGHLKSV